jgi:hypothetical protein
MACPGSALAGYHSTGAATIIPEGVRWELAGYRNYGLYDRAMDIIYTNESWDWTLTVPTLPEGCNPDKLWAIMVVDDHYSQAVEDYGLTFDLQGETLFDGTAADACLNHGMPYGTVFDNWSIMAYPVEGIVDGATISVGMSLDPLVGGFSGSHWYGIDRFELTCEGQVPDADNGVSCDPTGVFTEPETVYIGDGASFGQDLPTTPSCPNWRSDTISSLTYVWSANAHTAPTAQTITLTEVNSVIDYSGTITPFVARWNGDASNLGTSYDVLMVGDPLSVTGGATLQNLAFTVAGEHPTICLAAGEMLVAGVYQSGRQVYMDFGGICGSEGPGDWIRTGDAIPDSSCEDFADAQYFFEFTDYRYNIGFTTATADECIDECIIESPDTDGDGVPDDQDVCPGGDDNTDTDGDGTADFCDACPVDPFNDSDGDGLCDSEDPCELDYDNDLDGDGLCADVDFCPFDPDNDFDYDGICADEDICPFDEFNDADGDGVCGNDDECPGGDDNADADADGTADFCDVCPNDAANDADGDGICGDEDVCPQDFDNDWDGDGVCGDVDACPYDALDDEDGDGMCADVDPCPVDWENDADGDGICESDDNCPTVANTNQSNVDGDEYGDACEPDNDNDGVADDYDNCPLDGNADQADYDNDGIGDVCDLDSDDDGVIDVDDVCLGTVVGEPVLPNGCSWDQECVCEAQWKNHGAYVSCVAHATNDLRDAGMITEQEKGEIQSEAGQSDCGDKGNNGRNK